MQLTNKKMIEELQSKHKILIAQASLAYEQTLDRQQREAQS